MFSKYMASGDISGNYTLYKNEVMNYKVNEW